MNTTNIEKFETRTNKSVRLIAVHTAKKGYAEELEKLLLSVVEPTLKEAGNIAYVLHRSIDNPDELMFDEIWEDEQSLQSHLKQPCICRSNRANEIDSVVDLGWGAQRFQSLLNVMSIKNSRQSYRCTGARTTADYLVHRLQVDRRPPFGPQWASRMPR